MAPLNKIRVEMIKLMSMKVKVMNYKMMNLVMYEVSLVKTLVKMMIRMKMKTNPTVITSVYCKQMPLSIQV